MPSFECSGSAARSHILAPFRAEVSSSSASEVSHLHRRACYSSLWPPPIWSPRKANNDGATLPLSSRKSGRGRSTLVIPSESVVSANPPILVNSFSPPAPSPGEQRGLLPPFFLVTYFYVPQQKRAAPSVPSIAHLTPSVCARGSRLNVKYDTH